jgi:hypothetical protein
MKHNIEIIVLGMDLTRGSRLFNVSFQSDIVKRPWYIGTLAPFLILVL